MIHVMCYLIRHKDTGELMPLMRRGRGYSHWNPALTGNIVDAAMNMPRMFPTRNNAQKAITAWACMPNSEYRGYTNHYEESDYDICSKDDGRKKEDLEVVMVEMTEVENE